MTLISDTKEYKSTETVCNNTTKNCVVREFTIPGKAGNQISISKLGIDIKNKKDGVLSTCFITVESGNNEKKLSQWSNSKSDYTSRNGTVEYLAPVGSDTKIRVYLKTDDATCVALVKNFLVTWKYQAIKQDTKEEVIEPVEPEKPVEVVETEVYLIVKCTSKEVEQLTAEILKIAPSAKVSTLSENPV